MAVEARFHQVRVRLADVVGDLLGDGEAAGRVLHHALQVTDHRVHDQPVVADRSEVVVEPDPG